MKFVIDFKNIHNLGFGHAIYRSNLWFCKNFTFNYLQNVLGLQLIMVLQIFVTGKLILLAAGGPLEPFWEKYTSHNTEVVSKMLKQMLIGTVSGDRDEDEQ